LTGTPAAGQIAGPVLLYRQDPGFDSIIAYDLGASRQIWEKELSWPYAVAVAGDYLVLADKQEVALYGVDGSRVTQIMPLSEVDQEQVSDMAASSDGTLLALSISRFLGPTPTPLPIGVPGEGRLPDDIVMIYDIAQRQEIARFDYHQPEFEDFRATFGPLQWRDDGQGVFLWGATGSERPGNDATLFLDGRVVRHAPAQNLYLAPSSRKAAEGIGSLDCMFISGHDVVLRDLDTGGVLAELHDESRAFTGFDWSPDSREFLVESRPYEESLRCEDGWWAAEPELLLIDSETGVVDEVADLEALFRGWYGEDLIWLDCGGQFVPPRPHPFGNPRVLRCDRSGTLHVRGETVPTSENVWVLGIIE
jgi:hypothetical protein